MAGVDGSNTHGNTIGIIVNNQYGKTSGTYYYIQGLLKYMKKHGEVGNEQKPCIVRMELKQGT